MTIKAFIYTYSGDVPYIQFSRGEYDFESKDEADMTIHCNYTFLMSKAQEIAAYARVSNEILSLKAIQHLGRYAEEIEEKAMEVLGQKEEVYAEV